jgi:hypothetical protein
MRPLNDRERRLIRFGGIGLAAYLVLFFGIQSWRYAERKRSDYQRLVAEAGAIGSRLAVYDDKVEATRKQMELFRFDPLKLSRTTLVAQASAAIQQSAMQGGIMVGPVRELPSRGNGRELATMQIEAQGPPPSLLKFLQGLGSLGFPLVVDTLQITAPPMGNGPVKANLTLMILDFEKWQIGEGRPDA